MEEKEGTGVRAVVVDRTARGREESGGGMWKHW